MTDIYADHLPRSRGEEEGLSGAACVLNDFGDAHWLQFSMWHLYQVKAYLMRVLANDGDDR